MTHSHVPGAYEPQPGTKVSALLQAMRADGAKALWTYEDAGKVMGVARSGVPPYLVSVLSHRLLFRRQTAEGWELSLTPFEEAKTAMGGETTGTGWRPPQMVAPRLGSEQPRPTPAPAPTEAPAAAAPSDELVVAENEVVAEEASEPGDEAQDESEPEFDFCVYRSGAMQVWGLQVNDDGSVSILPEQMAELRKAVAWMPPISVGEAM